MALTRSELVLLAPLLILPLAFRGRDRRAFLSRAVVGRAVVGLGVAVLVMLPWLAYNQSRFEDRVLFSTNDGLALAGSNCDPVYSGAYIGYTDLFGCIQPIPPGDQSEQSREWRSRAFDYVVDHKGRVPVVIAARLGRVWQVFDAFDNARFNVGEGRPVWGSVWGILTTWVLVPFAIGGIVVVRRRRVVVWPLYVPVAIVTVAAVLVFGQPRSASGGAIARRPRRDRDRHARCDVAVVVRGRVVGGSGAGGLVADSLTEDELLDLAR